MKKILCIALFFLPVGVWAQALDGLPVAGTLSPSDITVVCTGGTAGHPGTCTTKQTTVGAFQQTATGSFASLNVSGASTLTTTQATSSTGLSVVANTPLEGVYSTGGGSLVAMCPGYNFGCPALGGVNAQLATVTTTKADAGTFEAGMFAYMVSATGRANNWTISTPYTQNTVVTNGTYTYKEQLASCISAGSGGGPSGSGSGIMDGTCMWNAIGIASNNGKIAINSTNMALSTAGQVWDADFNLYIQTGWAAHFGTAVELDVSNFSGQDADGSTTTIDTLYMGGQVGSNPITAYIDFSPYALNGTNYYSHEGLWFRNQYSVKDHDIRISNTATDGIFNDGNANHATAFIYDSGTAPVGISLQGSYSSHYALTADGWIDGTAVQAGHLYTVATLPSCVTSTIGLIATVTDANSPAYNVNVTGGGTGQYATVPAFCNGTSWVAH